MEPTSLWDVVELIERLRAQHVLQVCVSVSRERNRLMQVWHYALIDFASAPR